MFYMANASSDMKNVGKVFCLGDGRFEWWIDDCLSAFHGAQIGYNYYLESPQFSFANETCCIRFYIQEDQNYVGLTFSYEDPQYEDEDEGRHFHVKLGMKTGYRGKLETRNGVTQDGEFRINFWMSYSEMLQRRCDIIHDGRLTVYCALKTLDTQGKESMLQEKVPSSATAPEKNEACDSDSDSEESVLELKSAKKVREGLKDLFTNAEDCDTTIKIQGKEFPVHRGILRVRSPVFKAMFSHDTEEKETGVIVIEDCDPITFPDFLNHVYTGSTKHVSAKNVSSLFTASDKYCMAELKEACVLFMKNNISVDIFCDVLTLALRHNDNSLIQVATDFFCRASQEIIKTPKWHAFLQENTIAGNELFDKALSYWKNT